jgi:hypothetical protein
MENGIFERFGDRSKVDVEIREHQFEERHQYKRLITLFDRVEHHHNSLRGIDVHQSDERVDCKQRDHCNDIDDERLLLRVGPYATVRAHQLP